MRKTVDLLVLTSKLINQKYKIVYVDDLPEGIVMGMDDGSILVGRQKKERAAATDVPSSS